MELNVHKIRPSHKLYTQYYLFTLVKYNLCSLKEYGVDLSNLSSEIANLETEDSIEK